MHTNKRWGLVLVILGVLANNYVYVHDIIVDSHDGLIYLGWQAWVGIAVALAVVAVGIVLLVRPQGEAGH